MQPSTALNANRRVVSEMRTAHLGAQRAHDLVVKGKIEPARRFAAFSLASAQEALTGIRELEAARTNMLDGTARRYAAHAVRDLGEAVALLEATSRGADRTMLEKALFDGEVSTRLGYGAAQRSLAGARLRPAEERTYGDRVPGSASSGVEVDGVVLDDLGNPARGSGSGTWSGPDGERYDSSGSAAVGGSYAGPDGSGYSGI